MISSNKWQWKIILFTYGTDRLVTLIYAQQRPEIEPLYHRTGSAHPDQEAQVLSHTTPSANIGLVYPCAACMKESSH